MDEHLSNLYRQEDEILSGDFEGAYNIDDIEAEIRTVEVARMRKELALMNITADTNKFITDQENLDKKSNSLK